MRSLWVSFDSLKNAALNAIYSPALSETLTGKYLQFCGTIRAMSSPNDNPLLLRAKNVLAEEAHAIFALEASLGNEFLSAVRLILEIEKAGRIICIGVGKAGFIGMKISATFASLGVCSFNVHPSEAAHGDLGRISSSDLIIILSNSGQTLEILQIVPALKRMGNKIISITGNPDSELAKASDVVLNIGKLKESGPLGIAPTTSTTVMLALGDALATSVLEAKGITPQEFALNHPGGTIGRSLLLVREVMRTGDCLCLVKESAKVKEVLHSITITKGRPGCAVIIKESGQLSGFFTDGDLRRCLEQNPGFLDRAVKEVMTANPKTVQPDILAEEALAVLTKHHIDQVVVTDDSRIPLGIVDIQDVVQAF